MAQHAYPPNRSRVAMPNNPRALDGGGRREPHLADRVLARGRSPQRALQEDGEEHHGVRTCKAALGPLRWAVALASIVRHASGGKAGDDEPFHKTRW